MYILEVRNMEGIKNNKKIINWSFVSFIIIFIAAFVVSYFKNVTVYYWDADYYWTVADPIISEGGFNILNFPETFRGYFFPTIILVVKLIGENLFGNGYWGFRLFSAASIAFLFSYILPYIFNKKINNAKSLARVMLVILAVFLFWGDFLQYPLSDFPACVLFSESIALLKYLHKKEHLTKLNFVSGFFSGICLYGAYNTRAVFLYGVILALLFFVFREIMKERGGIIAAITLGMLACSLPQILINYQYTGSYTPRVLTEQYSNYETKLQAMQVFWGLQTCNYETYVGESVEYSSPAVNFFDEVGQEILAREKIVSADFGYKDVFRLFLKYPLDMCSIYVRHLISLLTPKWYETYIHDIYASKGIILTLIVLIWFTAGAYFLFSFMNKRVDLTLLVEILPIFIPCLLQLFGAPEVRFFLAIHLITYFYVFYYADYNNCLQSIRHNGVMLAVLFLVIYMFWIGVVSDILKSNQERTFLINDRNPIVEQIDE